MDNKGLQINNIVSNALSSAFPRQTIKFINKKIEWVKGARRPKETIEELELNNCRLQTMSTAEIQQLGFDATTYEYFTLFISDLSITQIDRLKQLGSTKFIYDGQTYQVVGVNKWDTNNWRECHCYKIIDEDNNNQGD